MKMRSTTAVAFIVFVGLLAPAEAIAAFNVPAGFDDELVVGGVASPTAIDFLPASEDGDLLIATQGGRVFRFHEGDPDATQVLNLSNTICSPNNSSDNETGLLGLAVDPDFQSGERFVYLYYTDRRGAGSCNNPKNRKNRVSRFRMNASDNLVEETVLIDKIPAPNGNHNGGDLQFDNADLLYVSVGDGGRDLETGGTQDDNGNARRLDLLNGKILRIERDGSIPAGNPFQGPGTMRCADNGKGKNGKKCREIFATGLRNPFRIAFDPNDDVGQQRFFINDVGGSGFEEVNNGRRRGDYGWNLREGPCPINKIKDNCAPSKRFDDPKFAYRRDGAPPFDGCRTITGGAFVPQGEGWPNQLEGVYLFTDLFCGRIFELRNEGPGDEPEVFADGGNASHFAFGPDGALYYTALFDNEVRRIVPE